MSNHCNIYHAVSSSTIDLYLKKILILSFVDKKSVIRSENLIKGPQSL